MNIETITLKRTNAVTLHLLINNLLGNKKLTDKERIALTELIHKTV